MFRRHVGAVGEAREAVLPVVTSHRLTEDVAKVTLAFSTAISDAPPQLTPVEHHLVDPVGPLLREDDRLSPLEGFRETVADVAKHQEGDRRTRDHVEVREDGDVVVRRVGLVLVEGGTGVVLAVFGSRVPGEVHAEVTVGRVADAPELPVVIPFVGGVLEGFPVHDVERARRGEALPLRELRQVVRVEDLGRPGGFAVIRVPAAELFRVVLFHLLQAGFARTRLIVLVLAGAQGRVREVDEAPVHPADLVHVAVGANHPLLNVGVLADATEGVLADFHPQPRMRVASLPLFRFPTPSVVAYLVREGAIQVNAAVRLALVPKGGPCRFLGGGNRPSHPETQAKQEKERDHHPHAS